MSERRPVGRDYRSPLLPADELDGKAMPSLVIQMTNGQASVERVRLSIDGDEAIDLDLPAAQGCWGGHNPVFAFGFDQAPGPVEVVLDLQGIESTATVDVPASGTAWAVVDVQSNRQWGDLTVYGSRPSWG